MTKTRRIITLSAILVSVTLLSGCSQEAAKETMENRKMGDYSYLSKAIGKDAKIPASEARTGTPMPGAPPMPISPAPTVAGEQTEQAPAKTETAPLPEPPRDTPPEKTEAPKDELSFIKKYDGAIIKTSEGNITVKLYNDDAPKTVNNFFALASKDFYDGVRFHRVIDGFMIQTGDPNSKDDNWSDDGTGGPGYTFDDEINAKKLVAGSVAMANSGPNTNGSQFFIVTAKSTPLLDGKYTNFGEVTDGMNVVRKIEKVDTDPNDHPKENISIKSIKFVEKQ